MKTSALLIALAVPVILAVSARHAAPHAQVPSSVTPTYVTAASIRDVMAAIIDPAADIVWEAVAITATADGVVNTAPATDEQWKDVRRGALTLIEGANLLLMPGRRVAQPGEGSLAPGDELHPDEIATLIRKDPRAWSNMTDALRRAANEALRAIDARDTDRLFAVGERVENACETCHTRFWSPNQRLPRPLDGGVQ